MRELSVWSEKSFDSLPTLKQLNHVRIYKNKWLIKEFASKDYNVDIIQDVCSLHLPGYLETKAIFRSEDCSKFYLMTRYLEDYRRLNEADDMFLNKTQGLLLFQQMLKNLKISHEKEFNPFDIHGGNYMIDANYHLLGIDQDFSFYYSIPSYTAFSWQSYFEKFFAMGKFGTFEINKFFLNLYDKLRILSMILQYLYYGKMMVNGITFLDTIFDIGSIKDANLVPDSVQSYLERIVAGTSPVFDDYFLEELIEPLLHFYGEQEKRKRILSEE